jgi:hypothetical protein
LPRPYDFHAHLHRAIDRQSSPRLRRRRSGGTQLSLFDREDHVVGERRLRKSRGLVVDDEVLFSRCVSRHSAAKAAYARRYAEIVGGPSRTPTSLYRTRARAHARLAQEFGLDGENLVPKDACSGRR